MMKKGVAEVKMLILILMFVGIVTWFSLEASSFLGGDTIVNDPLERDLITETPDNLVVNILGIKIEIPGSGIITRIWTVLSSIFGLQTGFSILSLTLIIPTLLLVFIIIFKILRGT